jgi:hypothetical protein
MLSRFVMPVTELVRGDQQQAIREFYAVLVHTSSTHAGLEYSIRPWRDRDFSRSLAPHGWFAAEYCNLLRNMMVREEGDNLHLLSAVSPVWIGSGKSLRVERAETNLGTVGFNLQMPSSNKAELSLQTEFAPAHAPAKMILHLPWLMNISRVEVDGKPVTPIKRQVELSPSAESVRIVWTRRPLASGTPSSYKDAVERYKHEYARGYQTLNGAGQGKKISLTADLFPISISKNSSR